MKKFNPIADILTKHGKLYLNSHNAGKFFIKTIYYKDKNKMDIYFTTTEIKECSEVDPGTCLLMLSAFSNSIICLVDCFDDFNLGNVISEVGEAMKKISEIEDLLKIEKK